MRTTISRRRIETFVAALIAIAAATILDVSTQTISFCAAPSEAAMCGSATLAIVVSSTCSKTAIITPTVTISRSPRGKGCDAR